MGDALGRGMGAVGGGEGVVDVDIAESGEHPGEDGVIVLLARVEARVVGKKDVTLVERLGGAVGGIVAPVGGDEDHGAADGAGKRRAYGAQGHLRHEPALGPSEMAQDDEACALVQKLAQCGDAALDARGIGHGAVLHGHIEVEPDDDAAPVDVEVVNGANAGHHASRRQDWPSPRKRRWRVRLRIRRETGFRRNDDESGHHRSRFFTALRTALGVMPK